jgi:error-prone DNA polymerase
MLCQADSVGVFQVESRAQMSMLPRLKPRKFYDLVIEVAIVRPGPIQGDMVHPYLRRREGAEKPEFPAPAPEHGDADELRAVLGKTFGVPLFQEQAMRLAIEAARFTDDEADGLRRSMATFRANGKLWEYRDKFIEGMVRRGYQRDFAQRCFKQIEGFGSYGFPESHAISFALLVYASAWVKRHHPDAFCAALLNSQPMGFYQPAQLVRDAREHGVEVRAPDVTMSDWDCTLEPAARPYDSSLPVIPAASPHQRAGAPGPSSSKFAERRVRRSRNGWVPDRVSGASGMTETCDYASPEGTPLRAVRLGLRQVKGFKQADAEALMAARAQGLATLQDYVLRAGLSRRGLELLAEADAFASLGVPRREALWAVKGMADEVGVARTAPLLARQAVQEVQVQLPFMSAPKAVAEDYRTTGLSLRRHPVGFFRTGLARRGVIPCAALKGVSNGRSVAVGGLVLVRQRPGTAKGVVFLTLEDETGIANIVVWADAFQANRRVVMGASFLMVEGQAQVAGEVIHVVARRFTDLSDKLAEMREHEAAPGKPPPKVRAKVAGRLIRSRDFH